jgi:hypothetical protein
MCTFKYIVWILVQSLKKQKRCQNHSSQKSSWSCSVPVAECEWWGWFQKEFWRKLGVVATPVIPAHRSLRQETLEF